MLAPLPAVRAPNSFSHSLTHTHIHHTHTHTHTHYTRIRRTLADWPSPSKDRFVVIASDGLWDEVTGEEAGKVLEEMGIEEGIQELGE